MKLVISNRQSGKTTKLIQISQKTGHTIVCRKPKDVKEKAKQLGIKIPKPMTYKQFLASGKTHKGFIIDDADVFLKSLTKKISYISMSLSTEVVNHFEMALD